jgi:hypothetical protein
MNLYNIKSPAINGAIMYQAGSKEESMCTDRHISNLQTTAKLMHENEKYN